MASKNMIIAAIDIKCETSNGQFSNVENDKIKQIATTFKKYSNKSKDEECYLKYLIVLGKYDSIDGVTIESYDNEKDVLLAWTKLIQKINPDMIIGYNIFGFDFNYMHMRALILDCSKDFANLERNGSESMFITCITNGDKIAYFTMKDRIQIDILKFVQRKHKLTSYQFNDVVDHFLNDKIENSLDGLNICNLCNVLLNVLKIPIDGKNLLCSEFVKG
jgi:DNA polymerase delta subunit 1